MTTLIPTRDTKLSSLKNDKSLPCLPSRAGSYAVLAKKDSENGSQVEWAKIQLFRSRLLLPPFAGTRVTSSVFVLLKKYQYNKSPINQSLFRPVLAQQFNDFLVAVLLSQIQRGFAIVVFDAHISIVCKEKLCYVSLSSLTG